MTKAKIVQRLLEKKQITAEEAVVLLQDTILNIPTYTPNNYNPPNTTPPPVWCSSNTLNTKEDWEYSDTKYTKPESNKN
jgi:hypothetical protein|tara:strand:- start:551 stop:787 length:237 start_codon:yes stop_codon:yes gene_type:complete